MKSRMIPVFATLILSLWLAACAPPPSGGTLVIVPCSVFEEDPHTSKQIEVTAGESFAVILCSNATTGYQWSESAQISDPFVVQQLSHEMLAPKDTSVVGAPGSEMWTFEAPKKGFSIITMEYSRPWEGGEKGTWTFDLIVTVN